MFQYTAKSSTVSHKFKSIIIFENTPTPLNLENGKQHKAKSESLIMEMETNEGRHQLKLTVTLVCLVVWLLICSNNEISLSSET